jgi:DNA-binding transcriptional MerR regulator
MAELTKKELEAFENYLFHLVKTSSARPFTTKEIFQILTRHGEPPEWAKQGDEKLIERLKIAKEQKHQKATAILCNPSRIHSLGELMHAHLVLSGLFINQLAEQLGMAADGIEAYIENHPPAEPLGEAQLTKLAETTGIELAEVRRIADETTKQAKANSEKPERSDRQSKPGKSMRPYPFHPGRSGFVGIRDKKD